MQLSQLRIAISQRRTQLDEIVVAPCQRSQQLRTARMGLIHLMPTHLRGKSQTATAPPGVALTETITNTGPRSKQTRRSGSENLNSYVVPSCLLEPIWAEFEAVLREARGGDLPEFDPAHPLGCHRRRIADRVVFEHLIDALVHGSGYERIATAACSDRTIRRRLTEWAQAGIAQVMHATALRAFDRIIGLELADLPVDGCITKAPCGGDKAGPSPVDRRKGGLKRSVATEGNGVAVGIVSAGANRHDIPPCWHRPWRRSPPRSGPCPSR